DQINAPYRRIADQFSFINSPVQQVMQDYARLGQTAVGRNLFDSIVQQPSGGIFSASTALGRALDVNPLKDILPNTSFAQDAMRAYRSPLQAHLEGRGEGESLDDAGSE